MSELFTYKGDDCRYFIKTKNKQYAGYEVADLLNELSDENEKLKLKIVSLENEVQRQKNELKNTRKEFTKKKEELNWLKSEDYLKKIY